MAQKPQNWPWMRILLTSKYHMDYSKAFKTMFGNLDESKTKILVEPMKWNNIYSDCFILVFKKQVYKLHSVVPAFERSTFTP